MDNERYADAVARSAKNCYEALPNEQGYIVRHVTEGADISLVRSLTELIEHANLIDWAVERGLHQPKEQPT